jgi:hypothetical protein
LGAADADQCVLDARAGQTMNIDLPYTAGSGILVVWGADGKVLLSDHVDVSSFQDVLPTTQDYYVMVKGRLDGSTSNGMAVSIAAVP